MGELLEEILEVLRDLPWAAVETQEGEMSRSFAGDHSSFLMGLTRGIAGTNGYEETIERDGKTYGVNRRIVKGHAARRPNARIKVERLWRLVKRMAGDFRFTTAQVLKNAPPGKRHDDRGDTSLSKIVTLGEFTGGALVADNAEGGKTRYDTHGKPTVFDARRPHKIEAWKGKERYSVILYSILQARPAPLGDNL